MPSNYVRRLDHSPPYFGRGRAAWGPPIMAVKPCCDQGERCSRCWVVLDRPHDPAPAQRWRSSSGIPLSCLPTAAGSWAVLCPPGGGGGRVHTALVVLVPVGGPSAALQRPHLRRV